MGESSRAEVRKTTMAFALPPYKLCALTAFTLTSLCLSFLIRKMRRVPPPVWYGCLDGALQAALRDFLSAPFQRFLPI